MIRKNEINIYNLFRHQRKKHLIAFVYRKFVENFQISFIYWRSTGDAICLSQLIFIQIKCERKIHTTKCMYIKWWLIMWHRWWNWPLILMGKQLEKGGQWPNKHTHILHSGMWGSEKIEWIFEINGSKKWLPWEATLVDIGHKHWTSPFFWKGFIF